MVTTACQCLANSNASVYETLVGKVHDADAYHLILNMPYRISTKPTLGLGGISSLNMPIQSYTKRTNTVSTWYLYGIWYRDYEPC